MPLLIALLAVLAVILAGLLAGGTRPPAPRLGRCFNGFGFGHATFFISSLTSRK